MLENGIAKESYSLNKSWASWSPQKLAIENQGSSSAAAADTRSSVAAPAAVEVETQVQVLEHRVTVIETRLNNILSLVEFIEARLANIADSLTNPVPNPTVFHHQ